MKRLFANGSYANVTATLALIVALGGTSYAAIVLPANSVGSRQLKKRAVTSSKLRPNAVSSATVRNGSLRATDFRVGQMPVGPVGPVGPAGPAGAAGATTIIRRLGGSQLVEQGAVGAVTMPCNPGERAITGGLQGDALPPLEANIFTITDSFPVTADALVSDMPTGWYVTARNTTNASNQFRGFVVCARP